MLHPITPDNFQGSKNENPEIKEEGLILEVIFVEIDFYGDGEFVTAVDLRPAGAKRKEPGAESLE